MKKPLQILICELNSHNTNQLFLKLPNKCLGQGHLILAFPVLCLLNDPCMIRVGYCNLSLNYRLNQGVNGLIPLPLSRDLHEYFSSASQLPYSLEVWTSDITFSCVQVEGQAEEVIFDHLHATAFQYSPLGRTILGPAKNIKTITKAHLQQYISTHYTGPRMVRMVSFLLNSFISFTPLLVYNNFYRVPLVDGLNQVKSFLSTRQLHKYMTHTQKL